MDFRLKSPYADIMFRIYEKFNIIDGDSAVGKSKLIQDIKLSITNQGSTKSNWPLDKIRILEPYEMASCNVQSISDGNNIVFIDRFDDFYTDELFDKLIRLANTYFIVSREHQDDVGNSRGYNILQYDGEKYRLLNMVDNEPEIMKLKGFELPKVLIRVDTSEFLDKLINKK